MSLTHIDIDEEELETAKRLGGHKTKTAAVAEALRQYNQRMNRAAAVDYYFELARDWDIEGAEAAHAAEKRAYEG
ncbi:type II toxin-antitoxin system VapB family antitoxin [Nocardia flavorosea]|uniref:Type II toxin-antitoxin system VapB family antitoxin n=1 Tax=Nocardia flavorosea TaxID=53429 RepID=A0A846YEQ8_9NOCA|nr:type II toxin-antitoxin system VapB family antitoxin [Nocardia flavorosea]NKY56214.1 type II toxin-antitoxin system VapB family antitoxin [Nocardia flavorosea]